MTRATWTVQVIGQAKKAEKKLSKIAGVAFAALLGELLEMGPYRSNWPNYGKLTGEIYHCHLQKGRPTYVACWRILDKKNKLIEVFYAGTHENAPY